MRLGADNTGAVPPRDPVLGVGATPHWEYLVKLGMGRSRIRLGYDVVDKEHFRRGAAQARDNAAALRNQIGLPARGTALLDRTVLHLMLVRHRAGSR